MSTNADSCGETRTYVSRLLQVAGVSKNCQQLIIIEK